MSELTDLATHHFEYVMSDEILVAVPSGFDWKAVVLDQSTKHLLGVLAAGGRQVLDGVVARWERNEPCAETVLHLTTASTALTPTRKDPDTDGDT